MRKGEGLSIETLASELGCSTNYIKQIMTFWVHKGVVKTSNSVPGLKRGLSYGFSNSEKIDTQDYTSIQYFPVKIYEAAKEEGN